MIVGEAPGAREDATGRPFIGPSGKLIRSTLAELGVGDEEVFYTNVARCRPPENRDPTPEEIENCQGWLFEELYRVRPRVVLALGRVAQLALLGSVDHQQVRADLGYRFARAYHPAYILRNAGKKQAWVQHLREVVEHELRGVPRVKFSEPDPWTEGWPPPMGSPWLAMDTETDDLTEGIGVKLVTWQLSDGKCAGMGVYSTDGLPAPYKHLFFHNAKYDAPLIGVNLRDMSAWDDTMLMAYVLRMQRVGLKELGPQITGILMDPISTVLTGEQYNFKVLKSGKDKGMVVCTSKKYKRPFSLALAEDPEPTREYALKDAVVTARLAEYLHGMLELGPKLKRYYHEIEKPMVPILRDMEDTGVLIDPDVLSRLGTVLARRQAKIEGLFPGLNFRSNRELAQRLLDEHYPLKRQTPTGEWQVNSTTLLELGGVEQRDQLVPGGFLDLIFQHREAGKLKGTYVDSLLERRDGGGRVHGRFNQAVADTNRLSSSEPNLQNIPVRTKLGQQIRTAFVAPPGHVILKADYSQLEVRIFAHYTREAVLLQAYRPGHERDVHQGIADELGIKRPAAKNVLFGAIYGADAPKLAITAGVPLAESQAFLSRLRARLSSLLTWQQRIGDELTQQGYVETLLGWRNYYPQYWSPIRSESRAALREAANQPIQGTAAGVVKELMILLDKSRVAERYGAKLLMQVHDELVYETPVTSVNRFAADLRAVGAQVGMLCGLQVPLKLEIEAGPSWGNTTPLVL